MNPIFANLPTSVFEVMSRLARARLPGARLARTRLPGTCVARARLSGTRPARVRLPGARLPRTRGYPGAQRFQCGVSGGLSVKMHPQWDGME